MGKTKIHIGLLPKIVAAMITGVAFGMFAPEWLGHMSATFNAFFSQYLSFMIPLIIVGFVTPSISEIGPKAGRMLAVTVLIAYLFTLMSGLISYFTGSAIFPSLITGVMPMELSESEALTPWFRLEIAPLCSVTTALVLAFLLGLSMAKLQSETMQKCMNEFRAIVELAINKSVIPLLPIYIFGIFLNMTITGQVASVLSSFLKIVAIIFVLHIVILIIQYIISSLFCRRNPFRMMSIMLPAYFTALGTQSSAATIPVTLRQTIKMGVSEETAGFVIPLCATVHLSGSTLKIVACALSIMIMQGMPHDFGLFMGFIAMLGITMVAAPGIPGGAIMAALGVLTSILGFNEQQLALIIALYIAMDSFGTACNVTGDGAIAGIIDSLFNKEKLCRSTKNRLKKA